jgi:hypothetical protein
VGKNIRTKISQLSPDLSTLGTSAQMVFHQRMKIPFEQNFQTNGLQSNSANLFFRPLHRCYRYRRYAVDPLAAAPTVARVSDSKNPISIYLENIRSKSVHYFGICLAV